VERLHDVVDELLGEPHSTAMMDGSGDETEVGCRILHRLHDHRFINWSWTGFAEEEFGLWDEGLDCWSRDPSLLISGSGPDPLYLF